MRTLPVALALVFSLLTAGTALASERGDAISSIGAAIEAVDGDGSACRRAVLADLKAAERDLSRADELRQATAVADMLAETARGARDACGAPPVRAVARALRDVQTYVEALRRAAKAAEGPAPMSASEFAELKVNVRKLASSSDKVALIEVALRGNHATVAQLAELARLISSDGDRLTLVEKVKAAIVDRKQRGYTIAAAFTSSGDGRKAVAILTE